MSLALDTRTTGQPCTDMGKLVHAASYETHAHLACAAGSVAVSILLMLTAWHPAGAQAQLQGPVTDRPAPALRLPVEGSVLSPAYPVRGLNLNLRTPRSDRDGWGFVASVGTHSTDLSSPDSWTYNPGAGSKDIEAGLSWQHGSVSTVVGYSQFDKGRGVASVPISGNPKFSRGVAGLSARIKLP